MIHHVSNEKKTKRMDSHKTASTGNGNYFRSVVWLIYENIAKIYYCKCTSDDLGSGPSILPLSSKKGFKNYVYLLADKGMWVIGLWRSEALHLLGLELQAVVSHGEWVLGAELRFFGIAVSTLS